MILTEWTFPAYQAQIDDMRQNQASEARAGPSLILLQTSPMPHCRVRFGSTQCGKIPTPVYIPGVFASGCGGIATVHGDLELRVGSSLLRISSPHSMTDGSGPCCGSAWPSGCSPESRAATSPSDLMPWSGIHKIGDMSALAIVEASETTAKDITAAAQAAFEVAAEVMKEAEQLATE
jgi:hypothetical protein